MICQVPDKAAVGRYCIPDFTQEEVIQRHLALRVNILQVPTEALTFHLFTELPTLTEIIFINNKDDNIKKKQMSSHLTEIISF